MEQRIAPGVSVSTRPTSRKKKSQREVWFQPYPDGLGCYRETREKSADFDWSIEGWFLDQQEAAWDAAVEAVCRLFDDHRAGMLRNARLIYGRYYGSARRWPPALAQQAIELLLPVLETAQHGQNERYGRPKNPKRGEAPQLQAERSSERQWRVWCGYCERYHFHGAMPGHRTAHCIGDTPYKRTGYVLVSPRGCT